MMTEQHIKKKKRKITLNHIGIVVLVIVIAANFFVWKANAAGKASAVEITNNIALARQQLSQLVEPEPMADLESRLAAIQDELAATKTGFPSDVDRNEVIDYVLGIAEQHHVQILPLVSDGWSVLSIGQTYKVLSITVTAEGSLENVKDLMTTLQTDRYPTLALSECVVERTSTDSIQSAEDNIQVRVSLRLNIYTSGPVEEPGQEEELEP